ncbi:MAG TPA: transposase [Myxococcota bacterium]|nr:transposase [Myxococcota bacterium]
MPHAPRPAVDRHAGVHVTMRLRAGRGNLRAPATYAVVRGALAAGCDRPGFRLVQFSVQTNHLHLIAEADGNVALARGMQGLAIRTAKRLNRLFRTRGRVFADRYHAHVLRAPREARRALAYILCNANKHGTPLSGPTAPALWLDAAHHGFDPCSSAPYFDGWREGVKAPAVVAGRAPPVVRARSWVLSVGWRRHGLVDPREVPGPREETARARRRAPLECGRRG